MNKLAIIVFSALFLTGCTKVISERDRFITLSHGRGDLHFSLAYDKAQEYCAKKSLIAEQKSTECPFRCISEFECVE